jgi:hypothetical protein
MSLALATSGCLAFSAQLAAARGPSSAGRPGASANAGAQAAYGALPLSFEANRGQTHSQVEFLARGAGYTLFLTQTEAVFALRNRDSGPAPRGPRPGVLRMELVGSSPAPRVAGLDQLPGTSNYVVGSDPSRWRTGIPTFARVRYHGVYPGVDLVYYGADRRQLEYDFVVAPGADPSRITVGFKGADRVEVDAGGDLVLEVAGEQLRLKKPVLYQEKDGARQPVGGGYALKEADRVGFEVGPYDRGRPLVIDPVLIYSTYLGGSGIDSAIGIAVDAHGSAFVSGATTSIDFPGPNGPASGSGGGWDAFVVKLNAAGTALAYSTYIGGSGDEAFYGSLVYGGIAVNDAGEAFITGITNSNNFPTMNAFQPALGGAWDVFVTKLNAAGGLAYSTYLGATGFEGGRSIAIDSLSNVYVTGQNEATNNDFPIKNAVQPQHGGDAKDAFVTKLDTSQPPASQLVYSTYLGGSRSDLGFGIAVDSFGSAYVTGVTNSPDLPGAAASPLQPALLGTNDAFVVKLSPSGSSIAYSTYLGGSDTHPDGNEIGYGIAVDADLNAYVTGITPSADFPLVNAVQPAINGSSDLFVAKLNPQASALVYSTLRGGGGTDVGFGIAVDLLGNAYVGGASGGTFPSSSGSPTCTDPGAVAMKLSPSGAEVYAMCISGTGQDTGLAVAVDPSGCAYVAGYTESYNYPTINPVQPTFKGTADGFVTKICDAALDHFKCYEVRAEEHFQPFEVVLTDQFERQAVTVLRPVMLCNPVAKCVAGDCSVILSPDQHLVAYETRDPQGTTHFEQREVIVSNQFGSRQRLTVWRRKNLLLIPSLKAHVEGH